MYLALPTLQFFKEKVNKEAAQQPIWQPVYGINRIVSGNSWVLIKKQTAVRIPVIKLKENIQIDTVLTDKSHIVELRPGQFAAIEQNPQKISIESRQQYEQLVRVGSEGQDQAVTVSQIIDSFNSFQQFKQSPVQGFASRLVVKDDPVNKILIQYHNKHLRNMEAYMVPVYMKETGNWHDSEYVKLNVKQL